MMPSPDKQDSHDIDFIASPKQFQQVLAVSSSQGGHNFVQSQLDCY